MDPNHKRHELDCIRKKNISKMGPFDQLLAILKDYIMLLHNRQRKRKDREWSGGDDQ